MLSYEIPVIGFAAYSGTGKTTLLTRLIPLLTKQKLRIGLIKHSHHNFAIDKPGKDSYRLREAGASQVMLVSSHRRAIITEFTEPEQPTLSEQLNAMDTSAIDMILVEGFKAETFPKIELHRPELGKPLIYPEDPSIIAVASNTALPLPNHLAALNIDEPEQICSFIMHYFGVNAHA